MSNWVTDDDRYYYWQGEVAVSKTFDPTTQAAIIKLGPPGGIAQIPALVKGDPGKHAEFDNEIILNALEYDDPTDDSAEWETIIPGSDEVSPVYRLTLNLHKGAPGDATPQGVLDSTDIDGVATDGYLLAKSVGSETVEFVPQRVGDQYWPASISNTSAVNGQNRTLASVSIPPQPFNYRLRVHGECQITGTANTRVNLYARLNNESSGDIVGRSSGQAGATPPTNVLVSGVAAGSASTVGLVYAGNPAVLYLRAEQQASTTDGYSTSASTTSFMVEVCPVSTVVSGS